MDIKRILALAGVVLLAALYIASLVFAVIGSPWAMRLFLLSVLLTIIIPVMIHLLLMMINIRRGKKLYDEPYSYKEKKNDISGNGGS
ncbi:MAG: hypothetical protein K5985_06120 [Lachnospiraceae bacterium]|nr:hypothetical protein [Lachnospiraceae bacterium]